MRFHWVVLAVPLVHTHPRENTWRWRAGTCCGRPRRAQGALVPEPLKNLFSREVIAAIGRHLAAHAPGFDRAGFEAAAGDGLEALELKARSAQITRALEAHLPRDFAAACDGDAGGAAPGARRRGHGAERRARPARMGGDAAGGLRGRARARRLRPLDAGARRDDPALQRRVRGAAVHPGRSGARAPVPDGVGGGRGSHRRRLASEGSRPRLPWGMRLQALRGGPGAAAAAADAAARRSVRDGAALGGEQPESGSRDAALANVRGAPRLPAGSRGAGLRPWHRRGRTVYGASDPETRARARQ